MRWLKKKYCNSFRCFIEKFLTQQTGHRHRCGNQSISALECLEDRVLLTTTGIPWNTSQPLTISFAPDDTVIAGQPSELFSTFDSVAETEVWQQEILRAFMDWSVPTNGDLEVVSDGGENFGIEGFTQGDSRFGDFRIGAIPLDASVLAISIPHDGFLTGTWAGDIIFNSHANFQNLTEIFSVALHESGHVWGLDHNSNPASPMNAHNQLDISLVPTLADLTDLQRFYMETNSDSNEEAVGEELPTDKTSQLYDQNDAEAEPISTFEIEDDTSSEETDIEETAFAESVIEEAPTEDLEIFSFESTTEVFDSTAEVPPLFDNELVNSTFPQSGIRDLSGQESPDLSGNQNTSIIDEDLNAGDANTLPTNLETTASFAKLTRFEAMGSLADSSENDFYSVLSPSFQGGEAPVITVSVRSLELGGQPPLQVTIFDRFGVELPAVVLTNRQSVLTIQAAGLESNQKYLVKVGGVANQKILHSTEYNLDVLFTTSSAKLENFANGTLSDTQNSEFYGLDNPETQLFDLALKVDSTLITNPLTAVQISVFDSSGIPIFRMVATPDQVRTTNSILLPVGHYTVRINATTADGTSLGDVNYSISGTGTSKPTGPLLSNTTLSPIVSCPNDPTQVCFPVMWTDTTGNKQKIVENPIFLDPWNWNPDIAFLNSPTHSPWYWFQGQL